MFDLFDMGNHLLRGWVNSDIGSQDSNTPRVGAKLSRGGCVWRRNLLFVAGKSDAATTQTSTDRIDHVGDIALDMLLCHF